MSLLDREGTCSSRRYHLTGDGLLRLRTVLNDLNQHPGFYSTERARILTSDVAFFCHGASLNDSTSVNTLSTEYASFKEGTTDRSVRATLRRKLRHGLLDCASTIDKVTGSVTMVVHIPCDSTPDARPEYIKAHVYTPRSILEEFDSDKAYNPIPDIVQTVIRELGVPGVRRFNRVRRRRPSPYRSMITDNMTPSALPTGRGMPIPRPAGSSRYVFHGRKMTSTVDMGSYFGKGKEPFSESESEEDAETEAVDQTTAAPCEAAPNRSGYSEVWR